MEFQRVLIANRGEIAVRIARTLRELGIQSVAVYSEADRQALHVLTADYAVPIGPAESSQSYLNMDRLIQAARETGAQAIHPGYGFLSENAEFARRVQEAGLVFIGPNPEAMEVTGDKLQARQRAMKAGVPVIPGTTEGLTDAREALEAARQIGFPVLLKAAMGGGGKGMRIVRNEEEFPSLFTLASQEAEAAFGDGRLYVEKYLENPRHVEIQILVDHHGNGVYIGERECSVQRRHQKVIEETPSPVVDDRLRQEMGEAAVALALETGYTNAGTVEFLVDSDGRFYFLEVNARLQVEHPITEMRFGLDLVEQQLRIAMGQKLPFDQLNLVGLGHAIEARIYAEDPFQNYLPSPGIVRYLVEPGGPGIRVDSGIYQGFEVPVYYDPILSKLIAWGETREQALRRLHRALEEYLILGLQTNIPLHLAVLQDPRFRSGEYDTGLLQDFQLEPRQDPPELLIGAALLGWADRRAVAQPLAETSARTGRGISTWRALYFPGKVRGI